MNLVFFFQPYYTHITFLHVLCEPGSIGMSPSFARWRHTSSKRRRTKQEASSRNRKRAMRIFPCTPLFYRTSYVMCVDTHTLKTPNLNKEVDSWPHMNYINWQARSHTHTHTNELSPGASRFDCGLICVCCSSFFFFYISGKEESSKVWRITLKRRCWGSVCIGVRADSVPRRTGIPFSLFRREKRRLSRHRIVIYQAPPLAVPSPRERKRNAGLEKKK